MIKRSFLIFILLLSFSVNSQENVVTKNFLLGKFDYREASDFEKVDKKYAARPLYLDSVVYKAFREMCEAAHKDGIELKIISGTRNFDEQKIIWEKKWNKLDSLIPIERAKRILEFSSMPATSRHHWGTDIDLNNLENSYFEKGRGKKEYEWLVQNAGRFGFFQVYTSKDSGRTGYNEEKWHWSYLPIASKYKEEYIRTIKFSDINGFAGSELAEEIDMLNQYVNGIPRELQYPLFAVNSKKIVFQKNAEDEGTMDASAVFNKDPFKE